MSTYGVGSPLTDRQDRDWIRQSLFVPYRNQVGGNAADGATAFSPAKPFSYGVLMFEDTSLGGSPVLNPKPQPCRFADPKLKSVIAQVDTTLDYTGKHSDKIDNAKTFGVGRWYAEKIAANRQVITLQAGVPQFNSLTNFLTGFYDPYHADAVNTGVIGSSFGFNLGRFIGFVVPWMICPQYQLLSIAYSTGKRIYADLARRPLSKFYYVKPNMALYWSTVQTIMNAFTVNLRQQGGIQPGMIKRGPTGNSIDTSSMTDAGFSEKDLIKLSRILPDLWLDDNGGMNVLGVVSRYERLAYAHEQKLIEIRDGKQWISQADVMSAYQSYFSTGLTEQDLGKREFADIGAYIATYATTSAGLGLFTINALNNVVDGVKSAFNDSNKTVDDSTKSVETINDQASNATVGQNSYSYNIFDETEKYGDFLTAELRDGIAFVHYEVDYEPHASDQFSNSTKESDIAAKMNAQAREGREKMFSLANGNLGEGILADTAEAFLGLTMSVIKGVADSVGLSGLAMLGGRAFVDIPEFWDSSSTQLNSTSYTIPLRSPSGHPFALLQNIYFPIATILALVGPRSTGRASYSSPFYVKHWHKGYSQVQTGLVTSVSMTRGVGNAGWNLYGQPIAVDIHITITDLSKIMHIPITGDLSLTDALSLVATDHAYSMFDEDTKFTDYMAVLTSLGLSDQFYASNRWRIRNEKAKQNFSSFFTMDNLMTHTLNPGEGVIGSVLGYAAKRGHLDNYTPPE